MNRMQPGGRVIVPPIFCALCALALFGAIYESRTALAQAQAQPPAWVRRLSPEQNELVWRLQAESVALELKLNQDPGIQLVAAYQEMRHARPEAIREAGQRRAANYRGRKPGDLSIASTWLKNDNEDERNKFKGQLSAFLSENQAQRASVLLGSPEDKWDIFVNTLASLGLTDEELYAALPTLNPYAIGLSEATEEFLGSFNWRTKKIEGPSLLKTQGKLKVELDAALKPYLSRKQFEAWKDRTNFNVETPTIIDGRPDFLGGVTPRP